MFTTVNNSKTEQRPISKEKSYKGCIWEKQKEVKEFSLRAMLDAPSNILRTDCQSWNLTEDSMANYFSELLHTPCTHIYCTFAYTYAHIFTHTHIHIHSTMIFLLCSSMQKIQLHQYLQQKKSQTKWEIKVN